MQIKWYHTTVPENAGSSARGDLLNDAAGDAAGYTTTIRTLQPDGSYF